MSADFPTQSVSKTAHVDEDHLLWHQRFLLAFIYFFIYLNTDTAANNTAQVNKSENQHTFAQ